MRLGTNAKLYLFDSSLTKYDAIDNVTDVTISETYEEANVTRRASLGFTEIEPTLNGIEISFTMQIVDEDDTLDVLLLAYTTRADVTLLALEDVVTNLDAAGFEGKFKVFSATRNQALGDSQTIDFVLKPCSGATIVRYPLPPAPPLEVNEFFEESEEESGES
jgi:hypothetical protein